MNAKKILLTSYLIGLMLDIICAVIIGIPYIVASFIIEGVIIVTCKNKIKELMAVIA